MKKFLASVLFFSNLAIILMVWLAGASLDFISFGRLLGLLAFYLILWQLLLIGRVKWIESVYGHDQLSRWHHKNGIIAWSLLAVHPWLILIGYGSLRILLDLPWILWAIIAYGMFMIIVPISFSMIRKRFRYEIWYGIHFLLYGAILLVFWHQLYNGSDLQAPAVRVYWQMLFYATFANVLWYRFMWPTWVSWRQDFRVSKIVRETHDVVSIYISAKNFTAEPGQFVIARFLAPGFWYESHPFTISRIMNYELRITPKAVGDYTAKLPNLPVDTKVIIEGPLGKFTADRASGKPVLLIAGGIGMTPLRVIFEEMTLRGASPKFIYAARSQDDFALKAELDAIGKVFYTTQRLTPEVVKNHVPDVANRFVYLCGPPPMMAAVREMLKQLGVPRQFILYEKFELG